MKYKILLLLITLIAVVGSASYWQQIMFFSHHEGDSADLIITDEAVNEPHADARRLYDLLNIHPDTTGSMRSKVLELGEYSRIHCSLFVMAGNTTLSNCSFRIEEWDMQENRNLDIEVDEASRRFVFRASAENAVEFLSYFNNAQTAPGGLIWQSTDRKMKILNLRGDFVIEFDEFN